MDSLSVLCVLIGVLIIVTRGPMIFAPSATLRFIDRLISTDARLRGIAVALAPLAVALIVLPLGEGLMPGVLGVFGWLLAAGTLWMLAAPDSYRRLARGVVGFFESSVDEAAIRIIGLVAVSVGIGMIYYGVYVA